ncbi:hypothetical protein BC332_31418 [Capsicum chinense]|nr:hypothetical protein BC332_31418 [Capsicum chinense]
MAVHDDVNGSIEKTSSGMDELSTFNVENLQSNMKVIYYSRTFLSIIGGAIAGILGLTGLTGFIFYFVVMAITSVALAAKARFSIHSYFDSWNRIIFDGFLGELMSFVLFWTYPYVFSSSNVELCSFSFLFVRLFEHLRNFLTYNPMTNFGCRTCHVYFPIEISSCARGVRERVYTHTILMNI